MIKKLQELMDEASRNLKENNENKFILDSCYKDLDRLIDRVETKVENILKDGNIHATEMEQLDDKIHFACKKRVESLIIQNIRTTI